MSSHSIFPWISSLQGFSPSPWSQGQGWKCPIKSQLRNVSKLENRGVRVPPCQPHPSPWVTPRVLVPWVKPSRGQSWDKTRVSECGRLSVLLQNQRKQPFLNAIPTTAHPSPFPAKCAWGSPRGTLGGPACSWSHPLAYPWDRGHRAASGWERGDGGDLGTCTGQAKLLPVPPCTHQMHQELAARAARASRAAPCSALMGAWPGGAEPAHPSPSCHCPGAGSQQQQCCLQGSTGAPASSHPTGPSIIPQDPSSSHPTAPSSSSHPTGSIPPQNPHPRNAQGGTGVHLGRDQEKAAARKNSCPCNENLPIQEGRILQPMGMCCGSTGWCSHRKGSPGHESPEGAAKLLPQPPECVLTAAAAAGTKLWLCGNAVPLLQGLGWMKGWRMLRTGEPLPGCRKCCHSPA